MLTSPLSGIPQRHGHRDGNRMQLVFEITLKEKTSLVEFGCEDRRGSWRTGKKKKKEYQESELDVSTDFSLLSRQLQLPSRPPQKIHSRRQSGFFPPNISLKSIIEYWKGAT